MMTVRARFCALCIGAAVALAGCKQMETAPAAAQPSAANVQLVADAYIFGYPLVIADLTRQLATNVPKAGGGAMKAPVNQMVHLREFPDYTFTDVVSPNADTLYSTAWLDLAKEPMVLSVPDMGKRYYLMMMMDAWTNVFAAPGSRTTGNGKGNFAIVGPRWKGTLPAGVKEIRSPTEMAWIVGRTQTNGARDYPAVHAIQDKYKLVPLSAWGKPYTAPAGAPVKADVDMKTPPPAQAAAMDATAFFGRLNQLMAGNPPAAADAPAMARFAALGVAPGKPFDPKALDPAMASALDEGLRTARAKLLEEAKKPHGPRVNGWEALPANTANFGTDYKWRAVVALVGLGANLPADAIYPHAVNDVDGKPLSGANRYVVRFPKGQLPPVKAFWSITAYNAKQNFVQNPINRYAIGDRDTLKREADGSLTIYVQKDSPGKARESNWLPVPADSFNLFTQLYWPTPAIADGNWKMPPVERVQ
ncbi:MAG TPA: DUF1254 domain-containing protein [Variovorax sp.]|nr:DUF1254 domain-containing protein [Variovorax sp.]